MPKITESNIESFAIEQLQSLGWEYIHGLAIAPGAEQSERENFEQIILIDRLRKSLSIINPQIPKEAQEQAIQKVLRIYSPELLHNNEEFHKLLVEKVKIPYQQDGYERSYEVALIDFDNLENNQFLVVNQFTVVEKNQNKRPDIILFVNGLPLVVIELKNVADENATIDSAFNQIQTYKVFIPSLFIYNAFCVISDGLECKAGSISAGFNRFMAWKTSDGQKEASRFAPQLEVLIKGMLNPKTLLDIVRNFIVFQKIKKVEPVAKSRIEEFGKDSKTGITQIHTEKILSAYHQYYAVKKAVQSTLRATGVHSLSFGEGKGEAGKGGVVWHTQGSGKSLSMVFYSGLLITTPELENPTIVVITDRNDLDNQLFDTFASSRQLLRQDPIQAESRTHLKELLKVASGGIVFTTIQKFLPEDGKPEYDLLSERRNIIVIADEAHRTQYGFEASLKDLVDKETKEVIGKRIAYGLAKYLRDALPNATYIGFTGTPIESSDVNTQQVFGQYVDIYDIAKSVEDGATVKIYYESRLAKVNLDEEGRRLIEEFDNELEQEELTETQKAKAKWAKLEAIVGNKQRIKNLAKDIVTHFEQRQSVLDGKGMIVAMSRRIAIDLYNEIIELRPEWHNDDLAKGEIKVVMTAASSDGPVLAKHHTTKEQRRNLADRMKDPADPLKLAIVRDMWLTGFDVPCLHTLYIDKPMRGHTLMQAIARVNRVFKDKKGGLIVDYLGIASDLKKALSFYSDSGGKGDPTETIDKAVELMLEKLEVVQQMFNEESKTQNAISVEEPTAYYKGSYKFNYPRFFTAEPKEKLSILLQAEEHILGLQDGKNRFIREVTYLNQAFVLAMPHQEAVAIKEEVAFFQAVKARLVKFIPESSSPFGRGGGEGLESAIKQIIDEAISSDKVIDIFEAAGLEKPEISKLEILSDEFLLEVQGMKHKNLAIELLKKLLNDEIKIRAKSNIVVSRKLLEMLESSIKKYQNNLLTTTEIIQELINIAKQIKESDKEAEKLGLTKEEVAFYDALETNDSAVKVLGDDTLKVIAKEIADKVRKNATIDWTIRESARAKLMVLVKRTLSKYGYPPDKQQKAIDTVLKQAELFADYITTN
ncbi:MAG: type I restriction endonuclease subunit R [Bacteroidetes bacterium]|nr:type I restriction endonuclease subunit R [Bacteroidota bacterium]